MGGIEQTGIAGSTEGHVAESLERGGRSGAGVDASSGCHRTALTRVGTGTLAGRQALS